MQTINAMDLDQVSTSNDSFKLYSSAREHWESSASKSPKSLLKKAKKFINKLPSLVGNGPSTTVIFDIHTSQYKYCVGNFKEVLGVSFKENLSMNGLAPFTYPSHGAMMTKHFPTYINHILTLSTEERDRVALSTIFKYKRDEKYFWISFRAFKYFSDNNENLGYVILEYTDITDIKNDKCAKFIVYDEVLGYIINDIEFPNSTLLSQLTPTEISITKLIATGLSDKEIAAKQDSAIDTIKQHKKHIFSKLVINKSTELVALAYECGLAN